MAEGGRGRTLCDFYIRHARAIGALYCIVPTLIWFVVLLCRAPVRNVYALRLAISLLGGGWIGAQLNRFGLSLWLAKHRSAEGPATALDGALIGAAVGVGTSILPPLTALIRTHHLATAKSFIICSWLGAVALGGLIGGALAAIGRRHLPSDEASDEERSGEVLPD